MVDYREVLPGSPEKGAEKEEWIAYLRSSHGDIEDAKSKLFFIAEEEGFEVETDDIEAVTDEPALSTFQ